ncbi:SMK killer toxin resistance protein [Amphichorda felina]
MASFMVDLWESIFTPGPTAPLLKAANASFAALQAVLLALLVATYSVHFVVLSILCAGLWWSVNWFAVELKAAQLQKEAEEQREEEEEARRKAQGRRADDSSDTEVETEKAVGAKADASASAEVEAQEQTGELKKRGERRSPWGTQSSVSTEDEWEKVSQDEQEKDK